MPELVPVRVRDCACPDTPHDEGDIVYMAQMLGFEGGLKAERQLIALAGTDDDAITAAWGETFVRYGAMDWNLLDENGPVPFDVEEVLGDYRLSRPVAERGMELYAEAILSPFVTKQASRSPTGQTARTTSRRRTPTQTSS